MVGVSSVLGINLVTMALSPSPPCRAGSVRLLTPKIGHPRHLDRRLLDRAGRAAGRGFALYTDNKILLPFAAAAMLWGHYWDASKLHDDPDHGRQAQIIAAPRALRLHVREAAVVPGDFPVSDGVRRDRPANAR